MAVAAVDCTGPVGRLMRRTHWGWAVGQFTLLAWGVIADLPYTVAIAITLLAVDAIRDIAADHAAAVGRAQVDVSQAVHGAAALGARTHIR